MPDTVESVVSKERGSIMSAEIGPPLNGPLRIGLIGSGFMAGLHVEAFRSVRDCLLAAVYSPTAAHRNAMVERINGLGLGPCTGFDSVEEMVAGGAVDAVWIVGPNFTRLEHMEAITHRHVRWPFLAARRGLREAPRPHRGRGQSGWSTW